MIIYLHLEISQRKRRYQKYAAVQLTPLPASIFPNKLAPKAPRSYIETAYLFLCFIFDCLGNTFNQYTRVFKGFKGYLLYIFINVVVLFLCAFQNCEFSF